MKVNKSVLDVIVLGVGSMGSAACYYLAKEGLTVLGIEQFSIPNELSSHTGQSRLIRKAYFENPGYVPMLQKAYDNWKHLETITGEQVYFETGLLYCGMPAHPVMQSIHLSADAYNIPLEKISQAKWEAHYAPFHIPGSYEKILEPVAGFLTPGKAIRLYTENAKALGAIIYQDLPVKSWNKSKHVFGVQTANGNFYAKKLVITAGAWSGPLLPPLSNALKVTRQVLAWMEVHNPGIFALGKMPCWIIAAEGIPGILYGFPILPSGRFEGPAGFKLAHHYPGETADPGSINRMASMEEEVALIRIMDEYFPGAYKSTIDMKICMYTNTPDEDFIIDFLPAYDKDVIVATGFSGHGFKFASVVGEIIADLVAKSYTTLPIGFLKASRFSGQV